MPALPTVKSRELTARHGRRAKGGQAVMGVLDQTDQSSLLLGVLLDEFHHGCGIIQSMRMVAHSRLVDDLKNPTELLVELLGHRGVLVDWDDIVAVPDDRKDRDLVLG